MRIHSTGHWYASPWVLVGTWLLPVITNQSVVSCPSPPAFRAAGCRQIPVLFRRIPMQTDPSIFFAVLKLLFWCSGPRISRFKMLQSSCGQYGEILLLCMVTDSNMPCKQVKVHDKFHCHISFELVPYTTRLIVWNKFLQHKWRSLLWTGAASIWCRSGFVGSDFPCWCWSRSGFKFFPKFYTCWKIWNFYSQQLQFTFCLVSHQRHKTSYFSIFWTVYWNFWKKVLFSFFTWFK